MAFHELKTTLLDLHEVLREELVTQEEFDTAKENLLSELIKQSGHLKDRLRVLADVSHVLGETELKEVRQLIISGTVKNAVAQEASTGSDDSAATVQEIQQISVLEPLAKVSSLLLLILNNVLSIVFQ